MNNQFAVGISYQDDFPEEFIEEFLKPLENAGIQTNRRSHSSGIYMALEWAVPTLVAAYLAKPFFEAFLSEAGKDAYAAFKKGSLQLIGRLFGKNPEKRENHRSLLFSIQFKDHQERSVKCIFPEGMSHDQYAVMFDGLYQLLLDDVQARAESSLNIMISEVQSFGRSYFIEYSPELKKWIAIDTKKEIQSRSKKEEI